MSNTREIPHVLMNSGLLWVPSRRLGWHPAAPIEYGEQYFIDCQAFEESGIGERIVQRRAEMLRPWVGPDEIDYTLIDIGIGAGAFVEYMNCFGYDINAAAMDWLSESGAYRLPSVQSKTPKVLTFWNSLQCIPNPAELIIEAAPEYIFASLPVFRDADDAMHSEHFKPGENIWYWTINGLYNFMDALGFDQITMNWGEKLLGLDGIASFGFQKKQVS